MFLIALHEFRQALIFKEIQIFNFLPFLKQSVKNRFASDFR